MRTWYKHILMVVEKEDCFCIFIPSLRYLHDFYLRRVLYKFAWRKKKMVKPFILPHMRLNYLFVIFFLPNVNFTLL